MKNGIAIHNFENATDEDVFQYADIIHEINDIQREQQEAEQANRSIPY